MTTLYKITSPDGSPVHGGTGRWNLPVGDQPGDWMPAVARVECRDNGYLLVTAPALIDWLHAPAVIWEAEGRGTYHFYGGGKTAFTEARLLRPIGRLELSTLPLIAADIAETALHIWEAAYPDDDRPRRAIAVARDGSAAEAARIAAEAAEAAKAAAKAATWAAKAAAWAAEAAAGAARTAAEAAETAAGAAAWAAAWAAGAAAKAAGAAAEAAARSTHGQIVLRHAAAVLTGDVR